MKKTPRAACSKLENILFQALGDDGLIRGRLSSSALSTAVALFAISLFDGQKFNKEISRGVAWLSENVNSDGAWGDTKISRSNLSTTLLCVCALSSIESKPDAVLKNAIAWIERKTKSLDPGGIASAIRKIYGKDLTFSAPILTLYALSDFSGHHPRVWDSAPQLPFEVAALPRAFLKTFKITVVSYALPALISIGLVRHKKKPSRNPALRFLRNRLEKSVMDRLAKMRPEHGGFLEAVPLTAFTVMSLIASDYKESRVVRKGIEFLLSRQREDGSWPIATDLAVWTTTLSVNAVSTENEIPGKAKIHQRLLDLQFKTRHPFTNADPGGWSWTDLPGGVPDADDTSGALIALKRLDKNNGELTASVRAGLNWLMNLQNKNGGIPAFCKGWGKLPFDRSCPEITSHALTAFSVWYDAADRNYQKKLARAARAAVKYLLDSQHPDGSWTPLWFGNENSKNTQNPVYGAAKVLEGLFQSIHFPGVDVSDSIRGGMDFLLSSQNKDHGWGGSSGVKSTIEETSSAVYALSLCLSSGLFTAGEKEDAATPVMRGAKWIIKHVENTDFPGASPIGLYFESLWYYEKLYPVIFSLKSLTAVRRILK